MKKLSFLATLVALLLLVLPLAACGSDKEPDVMSLYDSGSKKTISLGEDVESVVKKLGQPETVEESDGLAWYTFFDGTLQVNFQDGKVWSIVADNLPRYKIYNYHQGVFLSEVKKRFAEKDTMQMDGIDYITYSAFYDADGNPMDTIEGAAYAAEIWAGEDDFAKMVVRYIYIISTGSTGGAQSIEYR